MRPQPTQPDDADLLRVARDGITALNGKYEPRGPHRLLPVPPAARLESARTALDGLRTQTGQAGAVQRAAARRSARAVLRDRRRPGDPADHQVRHHAGHRYRPAARCRPQARRHDGASAEPAAVRSAAGPRGRGLRHSAAAHAHQPAGGQSLALRPAQRGRSGDRPVHARGVRRVPGPVRRGLVRRQRHLRRGRVPPGHRRALPGEPHPEPRPGGKRLCPLGAGHRRGAARGPPRRASPPK